MPPTPPPPKKSQGDVLEFTSLNWFIHGERLFPLITGGVRTDMKLVGFPGDQIQIPMKMKIMSERGGREVRHEHRYYVSNMVQFHHFIFNFVNGSSDTDLGNFLSRISATRMCMTV